MRADAVHPVIEADPFTPHVAFYLQGGKFVWDDAHGPRGSIGLGRLRPVGHDLFRCQPFLSRTEGTEGGGHRPGRLHLHEVMRASDPLS